jgi:ketosteroid isomerase-like protein
MASAQRQTNVEIVRGLYEAYNKQDLETAMATMADDIEWIEPEGFVFEGTQHGSKEVKKNVFEPSQQEFESFVVEPEQFIDGGDTVVVLGRFHATTKEGERIESPFAHVNELDHSKIVRFTNYTDTALWQ